MAIPVAIPVVMTTTERKETTPGVTTNWCGDGASSITTHGGVRSTELFGVEITTTAGMIRGAIAVAAVAITVAVIAVWEPIEGDHR